MTPLVRRPAHGELDELLRLASLAFGRSVADDSYLEDRRSVAEMDRSWTVEDAGQLVATATASSFRLSVPGAEVAAAGIRNVAVLPTHRRQGLLRLLMGRLIDDAVERTEPVAALWASEGLIYGRFGFGLATGDLSWRLAPERSSFTAAGARLADGATVELQRAPHDSSVIAVLDDVRERVRTVRAGMMSRTDPWWRRRLGTSLVATVRPRGTDRVDAYAAYAITPAWAETGPDNTLAVTEVMAATPEGEAAVWRYLLDIDLVRTVTASLRPTDEPLGWLLAEQRALSRTVTEGMWARILDVPAALGARRYASSATLVLEVDDALLPSNTGRWVLRVDGGEGVCEPTTAPADLALDDADLASVYLGGVGVAALHRAGRIDERTAGAVARADAVFAWPVTPWADNFF